MRGRRVLTLLALSALACHHNRPFSSGFEDIYPRAKAAARTTVQGEVAGVPVSVHAGPPFDEEEARRFLLGLESYRKEVEDDYSLLRAGLERHLGPDLMVRVDRTSVLKAPELPTVWYLLG